MKNVEVVTLSQMLTSTGPTIVIVSRKSPLPLWTKSQNRKRIGRVVSIIRSDKYPH